MAATRGTLNMVKAKTPVVKEEDLFLPLDDLSVAEDSGWRATDPKRVQELLDLFLSGQYGLGILKPPSVLVFDGAPKLASDGRRRLNDGKHTIRALQEAATILADEEKSMQHEWSEALLRVLREGVKVSVLEYPEDDDDLIFAHNVLTHDADSNKYKQTTLADMVDVASRARQKVPGGDWTKTQHALEEVYGRGKRTFCWRMVIAAQTLPPPVLNRLVAAAVPNSYIQENPYFVGHGATATKILPTDWRLAVINWFEEDTACQSGMSRKVFELEYCAAAKYCERWLAQVRRDFGKLADSPATARVRSFLMSGRARAVALACLRTKLRLDGLSDERPGIPQCRALVAELRTLKQAPAGTPPAGEPASSGAAASGGETTAEQGGTVGEALDAQPSEILTFPSEPERDPTREEATRLMEDTLAAATFYAQPGDVLRDPLPHGQELLILIDAPTSKSKVPLSLLELAEALLKRHPAPRARLLMTAGTRLDLLLAGANRLRSTYTTTDHYTVQLVRAPRQHTRMRPGYAQLLVRRGTGPAGMGHDIRVPNSIDTGSCRAKAAERTRLRCVNARCPLRTEEERAALAEAALAASEGLEPSHEIPADDMAEAPDDDLPEEDGAEEDVEGDDPEANALEANAPEANALGATIITDLWPFAYSRAYYKTLITELGQPETLSHVIIFTTSAHPAPILAALDLNKRVHVYYNNVRAHSRNHGLELLKSTVFNEHLSRLRARAEPSTKRLLDRDLHFIRVTPLLEQAVFFADVGGDSAASGWRAGLDPCLDPLCLAGWVGELMAKQLQDNNLAVEEASGSRRLVTTRHLKEGEVVTVASCLVFSQATLLRRFLSLEGNAALLDGPLVQIDGVSRPEGGTTSLYALPVGIARLIVDFRGNRKYPNCTWAARPEAGPNDGLLTIYASTHNRAGIACGSPVVADFGASYAPSPAPSPEAKRFKGALELLFQRAGSTHGDAPAEPAGPVPPPPAPAPTPAAQPTDPAPTPAAQPTPAQQPGVLGQGSFFEVLEPDSPGGKLMLRLLPSVQNSKKVPVNTVLLTFNNGRVDEPADRANPGIPWAFRTPQDLVLMNSSGVRKAMKLATVIEENKCDIVYAHNKLPGPGLVPPELIIKKHQFFQPAAEIAEQFKAVLGSVGESTPARFLWEVEIRTGKVWPVAVSLVNSKQLLLKIGQRLEL